MVHLFLELMAIIKKPLPTVCLNIEIYDLVISEGLYFNFYQKPIFKEILELARNVSKTYIPPNRKLTSKEIIEFINEQNTKRNLEMIKK